ncbi:MAG TPA: hypothetical protein VIG33_04025 [Pseudobdellovibrionaceae bacterium]|jgi:hypothetical protein
MKKKILALTLLTGVYSVQSWAESQTWVFTSTIPNKKEMLSIPKKETCRLFTAKLMSNKCVEYKQGYVCPQEDSGQFVISKYSSKSECTKSLNKARRLLARR